MGSLTNFVFVLINTWTDVKPPLRGATNLWAVTQVIALEQEKDYDIHVYASTCYVHR